MAAASRLLAMAPSKARFASGLLPPGYTTRGDTPLRSGENLFVVVLVMAPSSQELEPPANPGRFTFSTEGLS